MLLIRLFWKDLSLIERHDFLKYGLFLRFFLVYFIDFCFVYIQGFYEVIDVNPNKKSNKKHLPYQNA